MKYYLIAGEASGDIYAADLVRALQERDPACEVRVNGSDADSAVMGVAEVMGKAPQIARRLSACTSSTFSPARAAPSREARKGA